MLHKVADTAHSGLAVDRLFDVLGERQLRQAGAHLDVLGMDTVSLIDASQRDGVQLRVVDGNLEIKAKAEQRHWVDKLRPHKAEMIRILNGSPSGVDVDRTHRKQRKFRGCVSVDTYSY